MAAAREVCNATRRLGDGSRLILRQRVRGSARTVRAVRTTPVFPTETSVVADVRHARLGQSCNQRAFQKPYDGNS